MVLPKKTYQFNVVHGVVGNFCMCVGSKFRGVKEFFLISNQARSNQGADIPRASLKNLILIVSLAN